MKLSFLQAEYPQFFHPLFVREVLHPSNNLDGPSLELLQQVHVFPVLTMQHSGGSHQSRGAESLPLPAGHVSFDHMSMKQYLCIPFKRYLTDT